MPDCRGTPTQWLYVMLNICVQFNNIYFMLKHLSPTSLRVTYFDDASCAGAPSTTQQQSLIIINQCANPVAPLVLSNPVPGYVTLSDTIDIDVPPTSSAVVYQLWKDTDACAGDPILAQIYNPDVCIPETAGGHQIFCDGQNSYSQLWPNMYVLFSIFLHVFRHRVSKNSIFMYFLGIAKELLTAIRHYQLAQENA